MENPAAQMQEGGKGFKRGGQRAAKGIFCCSRNHCVTMPTLVDAAAATGSFRELRVISGPRGPTSSCNLIDDSISSVMAGQREGLFPPCQTSFCSLRWWDYFLRNACCRQTAETEDPTHCFNRVQRHRGVRANTTEMKHSRSLELPGHEGKNRRGRSRED